MAKLVSNTYGEALFELALETKKTDEITAEVNALKEIFAANEELTELLNHPKLSREEKVSVVENIFKGRISDEVTGILVLAIEKGRNKDFNAIFDFYEAKVREYRNIGVAYVTTPMPLDSAQQEKIVLRLKETTSFNSFEMHYDTDPSLIGGVVIRIGDRVMDSSLKTKLESMTRKLNTIQLS